MDQSMVPSGSKQNAQEMSMPRPGGVKHKIFLSHAGAQKDFVEQLHEDLVKHGYLFPFFDKRLESLLKGMEFAPVILEAARMCQVAVIVLSENFLSSKWAMVELATFHGFQQGENQGLKMFPFFYKLSVSDLGDGCIEDKWMPKWREHAVEDKKKRIDVDKWSAAVRALRGANGEVFGKYVMSKVEYRSNVVKAIFKLSPLDLLSGCWRSVVAYDRLCEAVAGKFVKGGMNGAQVLGVYGGGGFGKTTLCGALCDYFHGEFLGRVCYLELDMALKAGAKKQEKLVLRRQKLVLAKLFGIEQDVLGRLENIGQLRDLKRFGMINIDSVYLGLFDNGNKYTVPQIYREFAKWYVTNEGQGPRNVWGVVQKGGSGLSSWKIQRCNASASISWSNLVRFQVFGLEGVSRLLSGRRFQDLCNIVVFQLYDCADLAVLSLEGLHCLRVLGLRRLSRLVTLVFGGISSNDTWTKGELRQSEGIYNSLLMVELDGLSRLAHLPDLSSCTSLEHIYVDGCYALSLCKGMECSRLKHLWLCELTFSQLAELPNFMFLSSLVELTISNIDVGYWSKNLVPEGAVDRIRQLHLDGLKFCKHLKVLYLSCEEVVSIHGLAQLIGLQRLRLERCWSLEVIVGLSPLCPLGIHYANLGSRGFIYFESDDYPFRDLYLDEKVDLAVMMKSK